MYAIWNVTAGHWASRPSEPMTWKEGKAWLRRNKKWSSTLVRQGLQADVYQIREID